MMLTTPFTAFAPQIEAPGPRITSILSTFPKGRSKTSQKTPPVVGVYTVRPSISTNSSLLNRALNPRVLTALAVTYDHLGRFDLSSRYYDQAEKADPGSVVVAQDRRTSLILQQHGGFDDAEITRQVGDRSDQRGGEVTATADGDPDDR